MRWCDTLDRRREVVCRPHTVIALNQRRLRIEHVNSSVMRCRIVKNRIRLWKADSAIW
jgi:hypothetical protein